MTAIQKLEANENREKIFERDSYLCVRCGKSLFEGIPQVAHRIAKSKPNIRKYGLLVINHPFNLVSAESSPCNDSFNIGFNPIETEKLVKEIRADLDAKKAGH